MSKMRVELFVPKCEEDVYESMCDRVRAQFGGFTTLLGIGDWVGETGVCEEDVDVLLVFCDGHPENINWWHSLAKWFKEAAKQEAVLLVFNGNDYHFI